jgi:hypothetical protein
MKVQATVLLTFQAKTLADAGALLDDVLARAHEREDIDVGGIEVATPPGDRVVTLPPVAQPATYKPPAPPTGRFGNSSS